MSKNKLIVTISFVILTCISLGFFISSGGDPTTAVSFSTYIPEEQTPTSDYLGSWSQGKQIPTPGSYGGAGISYLRNDSCWLYSVNGDVNGAGGAPGQFRIYDIRANKWTDLGFYPEGRYWVSAGKIGPVSNTNIYVVGGLPDSAISWSLITGTLQKYNINTNTWTIMMTAPVPTGSSGVWGYQDSLLFAVGGLGNNGQPVSNVQLYNQFTNSWRAATPLPSARVNGWIVIRNDTIYYGCGAGPTTATYNNNVYVGVISQSDRSVITWSTSSVTYPGQSRHRMDADLCGCFGIFIGPGAKSTWWGRSNDAYLWNGGTSQFSNIGPIPVFTSDAMVGAGSFTRGNYIIWKAVVASGLNAGGSMNHLLSPPYHILNTQVYTDSCLIPMVNVWCEGFNTPTFPPTGWTITGAANLWSRAQVSAFGLGVGSAKADFYNIAIGAQQLNSHTYPAVLNSMLVFADKYCTLVNENDQLEIRASTNGGITWVHVVTLNGGINGELVTCGLPPPIDWKWQYITLPQNTNRVQFNAISAYGNNLYIDSICVKSLTGGITPIALTPNKFSLSQNYPNPFNPKTTIIFNIPPLVYDSFESKTRGEGDRGRSISLIVYDILGREIDVLVNEELKPGTYEVEWDGSNYSSGIYFYRLVTKDFSASRKMLLIK